MMDQTQIKKLREKHKELEQKLKKLKNMTANNDKEINEVKKEKLRLKDKINRMSAA